MIKEQKTNPDPKCLQFGNQIKDYIKWIEKELKNDEAFVALVETTPQKKKERTINMSNKNI